jgi:hypothetical protein
MPKNYEHTPKGKYIRQRANAHRREIPWDFTFETWWEVWKASGKWDQRGVGRNGYVMSRINDEGPYCPENVEIKSMSENSKEQHVRNAASKQTSTESTFVRTSAWEYTWNGVPVNRA